MKTPISSRLISRKKFHFGSIIGEGGFAVIREVRHIHDDKWFALKENNLLKVTNGDARVILNELNCLVRLSLGGSHPCIVKLHLAFRDIRSTYMVLDLLTGGDLRIILGIVKSEGSRPSLVHPPTGSVQWLGSLELFGSFAFNPLLLL